RCAIRGGVPARIDSPAAARAAARRQPIIAPTASPPAAPATVAASPRLIRSARRSFRLHPPVIPTGPHRPRVRSGASAHDTVFGRVHAQYSILYAESRRAVDPATRDPRLRGSTGDGVWPNAEGRLPSPAAGGRGPRERGFPVRWFIIRA